MLASPNPAQLSATAQEIVAVSVVVPCFNEEQGIDQLAERLKTLRSVFADRLQLEVVLVDDGSHDGTADALDHRFAHCDWARVVRHPSNQGITSAILTGIRQARHEYVASIDADCTYDPIQLMALVERIAPEVAMVTASPYHPQGVVEGVPSWRLSLSKLASWGYRCLMPTSLHTYTSCFRLYRRSQMLDLEVRESGFVGIAEMLWHVARRGGKVVEAPARLTSRRIGYSKMRTIPVIVSHLRLMSRIAVDRCLATSPRKTP